MKKILIITQYVSMPGENENGRFRYIADTIDKVKFDVELLTTNFSHRDKKKRIYNNEKTDYKFTMLDEPGYRKNVSLKRLYSHHIFAKNVKKYLNNIEKPDIIYCAVPSLSVAKVVAKFAKKNNIRFIIDIQDLWPEAFKIIFNLPIISNLIFYPMRAEADYIYKSADDIVAVSETYIARAEKVNNKYTQKLSVYLGTDLDYFDKCRNDNQINYSDNQIKLAYIGTLGHNYDLKSVIDALEILKDKGITEIKFVIMGSGPLENEFKEYAKSKGITCEFMGRLDYDKMVGTLCLCDIAINPIKSNSAVSIINKVGDYAAAGLPIINTQECEEYRKLVDEYNIGFNVENQNIEDLANKIEILCKDEELRKQLGKNNRVLAEEKFDRKKTYKEIQRLIES